MLRHLKRRKARTLVLHIGTEKTGSSSIQHTLARNRKLLRGQGVLYPESVGPRRGSQWGFVACARGAPVADDIDAALGIADQDALGRYRERLRRTLRHQIDRGSRPETVVVSSEHLHSRVTSAGEVARLAGFLEEFAERVHVVAYLRRQDRLALALHMTQVKSGVGGGPVFPDMSSGFTLNYFDYESLYTRWSGVFGEDRVSFRVFEDVVRDGGNIVGDFLDMIPVDTTSIEWFSDRNPSLCAEGYALLQHVNQLESSGGVALPPQLRASLVRGLEMAAPGKHYPATRHQAQEFESLFVGGNETLRQRLFSSESRGLFDRDFSEYPEVLITPPGDADSRIALLLEALGAEWSGSALP